MKKTYRFVIDADVETKYPCNPAEIHFLMQCYLNDPNGWGITFEPVTHGEDISIRLCMPSTIAKQCGFKDLSCAELSGKNVYFNAKRWFHGSRASRLSLEDYRQYLVSHEIGHILGHEHEKCPCKNCKAPIMMQQTRGIGECKSNIKV